MLREILKQLLQCLVAFTFVVTVMAQVPAEQTRILVPIYTTSAPGAHGTMWRVQSWVRYTGEGDAEIVPRPTCGPILCTLGTTISAAFAPSPVDALGLPAQAVLYHVAAPQARYFHIETRVRELSRQERSDGTEIPAVAEDEMFSRTFAILDIPVAARFRNTLRIYALPETPDPAVAVRYYRMPKEGLEYSPGKILLRTDRIVLQTYGETEAYRLQPSVAFVGNFQTIPELASEERIWIEIEPLVAGMRAWAFVSVTNDETQEVTLVTP